MVHPITSTSFSLVIMQNLFHRSQDVTPREYTVGTTKNLQLPPFGLGRGRPPICTSPRCITMRNLVALVESMSTEKDHCCQKFDPSWVPLPQARCLKSNRSVPGWRSVDPEILPKSVHRPNLWSYHSARTSQ